MMSPICIPTRWTFIYWSCYKSITKVTGYLYFDTLILV